MGFKRAAVYDGGIQRPARTGDGHLMHASAATMTADAASTITVDKLAGGLILRSGITAGRIDTSDTAANILAAFPEMDIGDSFEVVISNTSGFTQTLAGGANVTASGNLLNLTLSHKHVIFTKTSATAMTMVAL